jgi:cytochrome b6-f complex iron-sulfur subunit
MTRRQVIFASAIAFGAVAVATLIGLGSTVILAFRRAFLPKAIFEPSSRVRIGRLDDFRSGVDTRFMQSNRICVVRNNERLYVIHARCTHLGCTPDWVERDSRFRCPCHESHFCVGSAFDGNGINCEGPAPRPLDRVHVEMDAGQIVVNIAKLYQWPKGSRSEFDDHGAFIPIG